MYLAIDVGGTKTLLAIFSSSGNITKKVKIPTNKNYRRFLESIEKSIKQLGEPDIKLCCCALPGLLDRQKGLGITFGNLNWHNVPVVHDLKQILGGMPVLIETDANLAGLHEALVFHKKYKKVLYITLGTGIGDSFIVDGNLSQALLDSEGGLMVLAHGGKLQKWEDFASGRALFEDYGKKASEIDDPKIWRHYSKSVAQGLAALIAPFQPDVVIIGGSIGSHFEKFGHFLHDELRKYQNHMVDIPPVIKAQKPQEAVIYGCYDYIKQND